MDEKSYYYISIFKQDEKNLCRNGALTGATLLAARIPARQVYTPLWAHTDSNHAWVEAWVDSKWHFPCACESNPKSLPYVIVADKSGNVHYFSQGYNTGSPGRD